MAKPIEDNNTAAAFRTALDVPTNAALNERYTKPANGIPAADLEADPAGRLLLTATSAAERKQVLGLDQVNNTSDANKPVSTPQAAALAAKMDATLPALQAVFDGGTAAQRDTFKSSVSGYVIAADFAGLLAISSPTNGQQAVVSAEIIPGGVKNTRWVYSDGIWRLHGPQDLLVDLVPSTGVTGTTEQLLKTYVLPAGLLPSLRYMRTYCNFAKSGSTDAVSLARLRIGPAGSTSDTAIVSSSTFGASARQYAMESYGFAASATQWRQIYNGVSGLGSGNVSSGAYPWNVSLNTTVGLYLSLTAQMAGATDTPTVAHVIISGA